MVVLTEITEQSSSSTTLSTYDYDVFLSFRGEDTRHSFTDHLLKALREATIDTFFDDAEIQIGDFLKPELEKAIKSSRASIIVLSKNYASSTWCLDELALIMEQRRTSGHIVFPIFYHVKPSDVRKQRNSFGDAMAEHKQRMETELNSEKRSEWAHKIEKWKKALTEVADMKGEEANDRRETILIEGIVKEISSRLDLYKRSEIPHIIGMESSIGMITSFLKDRSQQSTKILTIWGMAGIGKTYLANYVFQLHYLDFERSCFLEDIERRCTQPNGLLDLQKQLLKDIQARSWMDIDNVNAGTLKIEKSLLRKRILLVLDGINKFEQLDVLIGTKGLHPGSKIIITSKNESLTEKCRLFQTQVPPKHMKHCLQGLDDEESLQLLSRHAFGCNEPNKGGNKQSIKVAKYCQGHPLALKVLGSSFRREDATWEDILESLGKEINPDIKKVLKISYDTLPSEKDKELFKYIACLFVGEDRKFTEDILKACDIGKSSGIKVLINRCLLTLESSDKLTMHQLLQDMGKDIVHQESLKKPWKRSILWHHEECLDVLQNRQGTTTTQGLALDMRTFENEIWKEPSSANMQMFGFRSYPSFSCLWWLFGWVSGMCSSSRKTKGDFETLALSEMRNLKLLQLNYVQLSGSYKNFPHGIRWLCMHGFPLSYIPSDLEMENLVALDLSNSKLQQLWKKPKLLRSLKFLNLSSCHELLRVGHFSGLPLLERLTLTRCTSLLEVCESIGNYCQKLEVIDLSKCNKLKELPRSIRKLKNLTHLLIDGCSNLGEFPADSVNMKSHGSSSSTVVPRTPESFANSLPRSLVTLSLKHCNLYNESFPMDFSNLPMLKNLFLDGNPMDSMPDCVRSLSRLETLSFTWCWKLKTVLCAPIQLKRLDVYFCNSLEKIKFHPEKSAVPRVFYQTSFNLTEIQHVFKIQALSEIDEEVLCSLGWINIAYLNPCWLSKANDMGLYYLEQRILPAQMLYEHGIFSTYVQGQEVPKWFTHRSSGSLFTLQSSPEKGKIKGLNVCIVHTISGKEVGPSRIKITNLTKKSSWTYQPMMYLFPYNSAFGFGDKAVVWLSHWMFGKNEFEDGDKVRIDFSVKHVREYGISPVYDDDDGGGGGKQKEDPLGYYKSWKHIIGGDLSASEVSPSHYLLQPYHIWFLKHRIHQSI
ncbi:disease resistance protein RPV1 isoform X2 [Helianthus annuus]|uniref:disease resistance protein RPV1 isoform X2 n=1 Tax=Helianthus annuus TaxID=4232 RepID=UPI0016531EE0|nr:disease resistance protein RPV1 isoform X2 [Helianthus annuus]